VCKVLVSRGVEQSGSSSGSKFREVSVDTKLKGDIAEKAAGLGALQRGWGVLEPVGDRLPYDLVFDVEGTLVRIQVKAAWYSQSTENYVTDVRRTKTNRREMVRSRYREADFDLR
jgi:hypothetical protein